MKNTHSSVAKCVRFIIYVKYFRENCAQLEMERNVDKRFVSEKGRKKERKGKEINIHEEHYYE